MSLKAKLEAVIYAAEEPVTLAQLALLFTTDALEWKAGQDAAAAAAQAAQAGTTTAESGVLPLIEDAFDYLEVDGDEADAGPAPASGETQAAEAVPETPSAEAGSKTKAEAVTAVRTEADSEVEAAAETAEVATEPQAEDRTAAATAVPREPAAQAVQATAPEAAPDAESEMKREARQRDRDVSVVLRTLLDELIAEYAADGRGIEIREVAGGYRMATKPECHDAVRGFVKSLKPPLKLSLPALETLAVIAYKQPVTAPEVNEIRGVDSSGVFGSLLSRKLIVTAGRKQVVGRPILYKTTREFLLRFGLKDISELPSMEEFEKLAASELEESEMQAEGEPGAEQGPELDETASEEPEIIGETPSPAELVAEEAAAPAEAREPAETGQVPNE